MQGSANLNIMIKAARKAGRSLVKDFREVENLQVSMKGAGDFVSRADLAAEKTSYDAAFKRPPAPASPPGCKAGQIGRASCRERV